VVVVSAHKKANPVVSWGQTRVQRHAGRLALEALRAVPPAFELSWNPRRSRKLALPQGLGQLQLVRSAQGLIDAAALPDAVTVRMRRGGERLRPRRGGPSRSLKSLLQQALIPLAERQQLPLVFAGDELVAAADLWVDARWQPGAPSAQRMRLIWHRPA
jgi:tRNA(Ile)-lysidine synthase